MSVSKQAVKKGKILEEIMAYKRQQLPKLMRQAPLADIRALASVAPPALSLYDAIKNDHLSLIAECKKASPSKGLLVPHYDAAELSRKYMAAGAAAISVLTDGRYFQGSLEDLQEVKSTAEEFSRGSKRPGEIPVLRKDFIFDPYQIYESRAAGADAILLIVSVLEGNELPKLLRLAYDLGLEALVEVHSEQELARAVDAEARIIGINNRDLRTFKVDLENSGRLRQMIPDGVAAVAESGIKIPEDVRTMAAMKFDAILVGEALVKSKDVFVATRSFVEAGKARPLV